MGTHTESFGKPLPAREPLHPRTSSPSNTVANISSVRSVGSHERWKQWNKGTTCGPATVNNVLRRLLLMCR